MITTTRARLESHIQTWTVLKLGLLLVAVGGVLYILTQSYPIGVDWHFTFGLLTNIGNNSTMKPINTQRHDINRIFHGQTQKTAQTALRLGRPSPRFGLVS